MDPPIATGITIVEFGPKMRRDLHQDARNFARDFTGLLASLESCKYLFLVLTISCQTDVFAVSYCYPGIRSRFKDTAQIEGFIFLVLEILAR